MKRILEVACPACRLPNNVTVETYKYTYTGDDCCEVVSCEHCPKSFLVTVKKETPDRATTAIVEPVKWTDLKVEAATDTKSE